MRRPPRPGEEVLVAHNGFVYYVFVNAHFGMWLELYRRPLGRNGLTYRDLVHRNDEGRTWARLKNEASFRTVCALMEDLAA